MREDPKKGIISPLSSNENLSKGKETLTRDRVKSLFRPWTKSTEALSSLGGANDNFISGPISSNSGIPPAISGFKLSKNSDAANNLNGKNVMPPEDQVVERFESFLVF